MNFLCSIQLQLAAHYNIESDAALIRQSQSYIVLPVFVTGKRQNALDKFSHSVVDHEVKYLLRASGEQIGRTTRICRSE